MFLPYPLRWSASASYDKTNLFHTQIVTSYPFDFTPITTDDKFALRVAQIPIENDVYYWSIVKDTDTGSLRLGTTKVTKQDLLKTGLDKFKNFRFEKQGTIPIEEAENFTNSQRNYLIKNYYVEKKEPDATSLTKRNTVLWIFVGLLLFLVVVATIQILYNRRNGHLYK
jgi:hypothetical protein